MSAAGRYFLCILLLLIAVWQAPAQGFDADAAAAYKVNKMKKELKLTEDQVKAVQPIMLDYLARRHALLEQAGSQGIIDHVAVKGSLTQLRHQEDRDLGKVLTEEQLKKWVNKENLMAAMNPDLAESDSDDGVSLTPEGANFKF